MLDDWFKDLEIRRSMQAYILRPEMNLPFIALRLDRGGLRSEGRTGRRPRRPRLHPTKGYRGAHKLFRGGSR